MYRIYLDKKKVSDGKYIFAFVLYNQAKIEYKATQFHFFEDKNKYSSIIELHKWGVSTLKYYMQQKEEILEHALVMVSSNLFYKWLKDDNAPLVYLDEIDFFKMDVDFCPTQLEFIECSTNSATKFLKEVPRDRALGEMKKATDIFTVE